MPGVFSLLAIIGLGLLAWILIRKPKTNEPPETLKPQKRG